MGNIKESKPMCHVDSKGGAMWVEERHQISGEVSISVCLIYFLPAGMQ